MWAFSPWITIIKELSVKLTALTPETASKVNHDSLWMFDPWRFYSCKNCPRAEKSSFWREQFCSRSRHLCIHYLVILAKSFISMITSSGAHFFFTPDCATRWKSGDYYSYYNWSRKGCESVWQLSWQPIQWFVRYFCLDPDACTNMSDTDTIAFILQPESLMVCCPLPLCREDTENCDVKDHQIILKSMLGFTQESSGKGGGACTVCICSVNPGLCKG